LVKAAIAKRKQTLWKKNIAIHFNRVLRSRNFVGFEFWFFLYALVEMRELGLEFVAVIGGLGIDADSCPSLTKLYVVK